MARFPRLRPQPPEFGPNDTGVLPISAIPQAVRGQTATAPTPGHSVLTVVCYRAVALGCSLRASETPAARHFARRVIPRCDRAELVP